MDTTNRSSGIGVNEICSWFKRERVPELDEERVAQLYFAFHPRTVFLKTLRSGSAVVDIGAGDGSLSVFRAWPEPVRDDLHMYAYSIEKGRLFDDFSGYEISDWNVNPPEFDGRQFDGIVCAHFIEHIQDPVSLVKWAANKLKSGGRIYLEWPSADSLSLPSRTELEQLGVPLIISRFDDDNTHQALPDGNLIATALQENGFSVEARGVVRLPWLEDQMLARHRDSTDGFYRQAAFWSHTGWCQYIVAELARATDGREPARSPARLAPTESSQTTEGSRHRLATLQAEHKASVSHARALEKKLAEVEELLARERALSALHPDLLVQELQRTAADNQEKLRSLAEKEEENSRLLADLKELRKGYELMSNSRSWKLTAPLRALSGRLRGR